MNQTVNLLAPGNPPSQVIGTATLTGLPDQRYPGDLQWLAPVIGVGGRTFLYVDQPFFGPEPTPSYVEVRLFVATGTFA